MYFTESPLAFGPLFEIHRQRFEALVAAHPELSEKRGRAQHEMAFDSMLVRDSLDRYRAQPVFLLKKIALKHFCSGRRLPGSRIPNRPGHRSASRPAAALHAHSADDRRSVCRWAVAVAQLTPDVFSRLGDKRQHR
ncbi:MAG: hypothetical protein HYS04_09050 [Acidobacteria bacterium]|nr:hypothetical protein [Acidobacteriota bacterium]